MKYICAEIVKKPITFEKIARRKKNYFWF